MQPTSHLCERARLWASLRVDGELSELELALLYAHLERCASCRTFALGAEGIAVTLRAAPHDEAGSRVMLPARRRRIVLHAVQGAAAVAVVAAAGLFAAYSVPSSGLAAAKPVSMIAGLDSPDRLRELRRPGLVKDRRAVPRNRQVPGEAV